MLLEKNLIQLKEECWSSALKIKAIRSRGQGSVSKSIEKTLDELKMAGTQVEFGITELDTLNRYGADEIELRFSP